MQPVVEMDPLRVEVVGPDDKAAPRGPDARPLTGVADDRDLAEVVRRARRRSLCSPGRASTRGFRRSRGRPRLGSKTPLVSASPVESLSITSPGGTRPPLPITDGPGRRVPVRENLDHGRDELGAASGCCWRAAGAEFGHEPVDENGVADGDDAGGGRPEDEQALRGQPGRRRGSDPGRRSRSRPSP